MRLEGVLLSAKPFNFGLLGSEDRYGCFGLGFEDSPSLGRRGAASGLSAVAALAVVVLVFVSLLGHLFFQPVHPFVMNDGKTAWAFSMIAEVDPGGVFVCLDHAIAVSLA